MKRATFISLAGSILINIKNIWNIVEEVSARGFGGVYQCAITVDKPCSFLSYVFNSDFSMMVYVGIVLSFTVLFIVSTYIFFLIKIYKSNNKKLFWILIGVGVLIAVVSYLLHSYF